MSKPHALDWQQRDVPDSVGAGFDRPEQLLAALAGELIDLSPGEVGTNAVLRLRPKGSGFIGEITVRDLPDDSAAALQFRATFTKRGGGWRAVALQERVICRRGGSGEACL